MGLDVNGVRFMLRAASRGVNFARVATLGRQGMHLSGAQLNALLSKLRPRLQSSSLTAASSAPGQYSEDFFRYLGAKHIDSIDYSGYEGASLCHDLNSPIPRNLARKFSVVVDAGTLEHVFNFPVAIKNAMELVEKNGHLIIVTPVNNFMGHGFYQFSPELFFSVLSEENGFELEEMVVTELYDDSQWYRVTPPKGGIQGRVTLNNREPTYLMCLARRVSDTCEIFATSPQQVDHQQAWSHESGTRQLADEPRQKSIAPVLKTLLQPLKGVMWVRRLARLTRHLHRNPWTPQHYTPIEP